MTEKILPLGTVVTLSKGDGTELMIISRASITENEAGKKVYFDYGAVVVPNGLQDAKHVLFFNQEDIKQVIFKGYINLHEQQFEREYNSLIEKVDIPKGSVDE